MKPYLRQTLNITLPIIFGLLIIWWAMGSLSEKDLNDIKYAFLNANYTWVLFGFSLGLLSHFSRSYRWKYLLEPLGYKPKFLNTVFAVFIGYMVNLIIPRGGEVARATSLGKYEGIPFDKAFGTVLAERMVDLFMLLGIFIFAFFMQMNFFTDLILQKLPELKLWTILTIAIIILTLIVFTYKIKTSNHHLFKKIRSFLKGFWEGISSIWKMKQKYSFIAHSLFIWTMYVLMFYTVALSIKGTSNLSLGAILSSFIAGTIGVTTNGGLGTFPFAIKETLNLYQISDTDGWALGWLLWVNQTGLVIIAGLLSSIALPLFNKRFFKA